MQVLQLKLYMLALCGKMRFVTHLVRRERRQQRSYIHLLLRRRQHAVHQLVEKLYRLVKLNI